MDKANKKLSADLAYNYISIAVTAVCGAAFSIIISLFYPESVLGRFNTVYAYYVVLSQFCAFGVQMAVVRYAASETGPSANIRLLLRALSVSFAATIVVCLAGIAFLNVALANLLGESMLRSFNTIWPALLFFAANKVFLGWLNGHSWMKAYAFFQAARNVLIALGLVIFALYGLPGDLLPVCFAFGECILFVAGVGFLLVNRHRICYDRTDISTKELAWFGARILPSNAVLELNTRIDVICLSLILRNESLVGIYSFAAMFGEGFYQLLIVIRKMINPGITRSHSEGRIESFITDFGNRYTKWLYGGFTVAFLAVLGGYLLIVRLIGNESYIYGLIPLAILCVSMVINTRSIVFGNILAQTGYPSEESMLNIVTTVSNGVLNYLLISYLGMTGAAIATGLSYFVYRFVQRGFVKRRIGIVI